MSTKITAKYFESVMDVIEFINDNDIKVVSITPDSTANFYILWYYL